MSKHYLKFLCCGVLCVCSVFAFAQKDKKGKTTPAATIALPEVIDFNTVKSLGVPSADNSQSKGSSKTSSSGSGNNLDKTAIVLAPFNILQGFADIGFERAITNNFSIEVDGGVALTRSSAWSVSDAIFGRSAVSNIVTARTNYWSNQGKILESIAVPWSPAYTLGQQYSVTNLETQATEKLGLSLCLTPRFYLGNGEVFDGSYLGARFHYVGLNYEVPHTYQIENNQLKITNTPTEISRTVVNILPIYGFLFNPSKRFRWGYELGLGASIRSLNSFEIVRDANANYEKVPYSESFTVLSYYGALRALYTF